MTKIRFLFAGNFDIDGKAQHFKRGQVIDAREEEAAPLVVGKCAVYVRDEPEPEAPPRRVTRKAKAGE